MSPVPTGFSAPGTRFVNIDLKPVPAFPLRPPGLTVVLPLVTQLTPGTRLGSLPGGSGFIELGTGGRRHRPSCFGNGEC